MASFDLDWEGTTDEQAFKAQTKAIALRTSKPAEVLPPPSIGDVLGKQLLRSATSVGANYRAVCRAKSPADMIDKLHIVEKEADESGYWPDSIGESRLMPYERVADLMREFREITAMVVASQKTLRPNVP